MACAGAVQLVRPQRPACVFFNGYNPLPAHANFSGERPLIVPLFHPRVPDQGSEFGRCLDPHGCSLIVIDR